MTNKMLDIPSYQEIYYICYLTQHGWEPDYNCTKWKKEGFKQLEKVTKRDQHGYYDAEEETEWFSLEDAYWKQIEKEEQAKCQI